MPPPRQNQTAGRRGLWLWSFLSRCFFSPLLAERMARSGRPTFGHGIRRSRRCLTLISMMSSKQPRGVSQLRASTFKETAMTP